MAPDGVRSRVARNVPADKSAEENEQIGVARGSVLHVLLREQRLEAMSKPLRAIADVLRL